MLEGVDWQRRLREEAACWGVQVTSEAAARLWEHWQEVKAARRVVNWTSVLDDQEALAVHYIDSLAPLAQGRTWAERGLLMDVGSGAGFPGVPVLSVLDPRWTGVLVESHRRKASFLTWVAQRLGLTAVQVLAQRVEDVGRDARWREQADAVLVRALAPLDVVAEYGLPLLKVGGRLWVYKGPGAGEEVARYEAAVRRLGGAISGLWPYRLPMGAGRRVLVEVKKQQRTPDEFPRRAGVPARRPLGRNCRRRAVEVPVKAGESRAGATRRAVGRGTPRREAQ